MAGHAVSGTLGSTFIAVTLALVAGAVLGGLAVWFARNRADRLRRRSEQAHESEVARAIGRARDRAREEKAAAEERAERIGREHAGCAERLAQLELRLERQAGELRAARSEPSVASPAPGSAEVGLPEEWTHPATAIHDDLTEIRGVGPVLAERLNRLGISRYRQLARITPENVGWIAARLGVHPGRILKDRWAVQAGQLHLRSYGERIESLEGPGPTRSPTVQPPDEHFRIDAA